MCLIFKWHSEKYPPPPNLLLNADNTFYNIFSFQPIGKKLGSCSIDYAEPRQPSARLTKIFLEPETYIPAQEPTPSESPSEYSPSETINDNTQENPTPEPILEKNEIESATYAKAEQSNEYDTNIKTMKPNKSRKTPKRHIANPLPP